MNAKRGTIGIETITESFFVRTRLNDDHVIHFATLYEAGTKLPPLLIARADNAVIDGRHRLAALKMLDKKSADVEWVEETDTTLLLARALKANVGGALPPTNNDIVYALRQMLEQGTPMAAVGRHFEGVWPPAVVRRYLSDAQSALTKERVLKAKADIINKNMTVHDAAVLHKIKPETLKSAMSTKRTRRGSASDFMGALTNVFRSRGASAGMIMRKVLQQYEDGDMSKATAEKVIAHYDKCTRATVNSAKDWANRINAVRKE